MRFRLTVSNFLQFAAWGAYLTSMGGYLSRIGMANHIGSFFAISGIVALFMPAIVGIIADKWVQAQKMYGICHLISAVAIAATGLYGQMNGAQSEFWPLFLLYTISITFYMPSLSLNYSVSYSLLRQSGEDIVKVFPPIRVFGTIGFIAAMLLVDVTGFQHTYHQFYISGVLELILAVWAFTLPACQRSENSSDSTFLEKSGLKAFTLFRKREMAVFLIFSMLLGISLHISEAYVNPFLIWFGSLPQYAGSFASAHPNALLSISRVAETFCILLIPFCMKKFGIKWVMLIAMIAWVLHFACLGLGNPGDGMWLFMISMLVYGVAFDFFSISGSIYMDQQVDSSMRSTAQGLYSIMSNGIGTAVGTWGAQIVINRLVYDAAVPNWSCAWYIFAGYSLVITIVFALLFRVKK